MADLTPKTISELPTAGAPSNADLFPISHNGESQKQSWHALKTALGVPNVPITIEKGELTAGQANELTLIEYETGAFIISSAATTKSDVVLYRSRSGTAAAFKKLSTTSDLTISADVNKLTFTPSYGANAYYIKLRWDGTGSGGGGGGGGGGGTSDYNDLLNKPQINGVTLVGNKTLAQIGAGTYSKPSGGIPKSDLAAAVQTSLGKADTALQTAPVTSVNGMTGDVVLSMVDRLYWATYGTTTTTEIKAANAAGKIVLVTATDTLSNTYILSLNEIADDDTCEFGGGTGAKLISVELTAPDDWGVLTISEFSSPQTSGTTQPLGAASIGTANDCSRSDHVHPMPSAADIGAIAAPSSPATGAFLVWSGAAWVAQTLSTWHGGNY